MQKSKSNKDLIEEVLKEINSLKNTLAEIRLELAKQSQIEDKLKKGENLAASNGGWFFSTFNAN